MKPWLRRIAIALVVLVVLALLSPLVVITALQNDQVRALGVDRVVGEINQQLPGTVEVDRVEGSLLGHARVMEIRLTDERGNLVAQIDEADVSFRMLPVLSGSVVVDELELGETTVVARNYEDDTFNWDLMLDPEPTVDPFDWPVYLDAVDFSDVAVAYLDETVDIEDEPQPLHRWRQARGAELDEATHAADIRSAWTEGFAPQQLEQFADPRVPTAAWLTDLAGDAELAMQGRDMTATVPEISGQFQTDILADAPALVAEQIDAATSVSTIEARVDTLDIEDRLLGEEISAKVTRPTLQRRLDAWEAEEPLDEPFERIFADLSRFEIYEPTIRWAVGDELPVAAPLFVGGDAAFDQDVATVDITVQHADANQPVEISGRLSDYQLDDPAYDFVARGEQFELHEWIRAPEIVPVETDFLTDLQGRGFDIETLDATWRLRLDDTLVDDTYGAQMLYASADIEDGVVDTYNFGALTPYLDFLATGSLDLHRGHATARVFSTADGERTGEQADLRAGRAEADLQMALAFEPNFEPVDELDELAERFVAVRADADWEFADFAFDELRLDESSGEMAVDVRRAGDRDYDVDYRASVTARDVQFDEYGLESLQLTDRGEATARFPVDDPIDALQSLDNDADLQLTGLTAPQLQLNTASATAAVDYSGAAGRATTGADIRIGGLRSDEADVVDLRARFDGQLGVGDADMPLRWLDGTAFADATGVSTPDGSIGSLEATLSGRTEMTHPDPLPVERFDGELSAEGSELSAPELWVETFDVQFDGTADLTGDEIPVQTLEATAFAEASGLRFEDVAATGLEGEFDGTLAVADPTVPPAESPVEFRGSVEGLEHPEATVDAAEATFDGEFRLADTQMPLRRIEGELLAESTGVTARDVGDIESLTAASLDGGFDGTLQLVDAPMPLEALTGRLGVRTAEVSAHPFDVESADATLEGDLDFGTGYQSIDELIEHLDVETTASADAILADPWELSVDAAETTLEIAGPIEDPGGEFNAEAHQIRFADQRLDYATVGFALFEQLRRGTAVAEVHRREDQYVEAQSAIQFERDYEAFSLYNMSIQTGRSDWETLPDSLLRWTGTRAEAHQFQLTSPDHVVSLHGHFHPGVDQRLVATADLSLDALFEELYLHEIFADVPALGGEFSAEARVGGSAEQPLGELTAHLRRFYYEDHGPFGGELSFEYAGERLRLHHLEAFAFEDPVFRASGSVPVSLDMAANWEFFPERHAEIDAQLFPQRLRDFHRLAPILNQYGIDGVVAAGIEAEGTVDRPQLEGHLQLEDFRVQAEFEEEFLDIRGVDADSQLEYVPTAIGGEGLDLSADVAWEEETTGEFDASTALAIEQWLVEAAEQRQVPELHRDQLAGVPFELSAQVPALQLGELPLEEFTDRHTLQGLVQFALEADGTFDDPTGELELSVHDLGWLGFPWEGVWVRGVSFQLDTRLADQLAHFDQMRLDWHDDTVFTGQGLLPLPLASWFADEPLEDLDIDFAWQLHELHAEDLLSSLGVSPGDIGGVATADLQLDGSLRSPEFELDAGLSQLNLPDDAVGETSFEIAGADDRIDAEGEAFRNDEQLFDFQGDAPVDLDVIGWQQPADWQAPGALDFELQTVPLDLAEVVPTEPLGEYAEDVAGILEVTAQLGGSWDDPVATGEMELTDGAVTVPEFDRAFENIEASLQLDPRELTIETVELEDGPSSLSASGSVDHDGLIPGRVDLRADTEEFNIAGFGVDFPMLVTSSTTARGEILGDPGEIDVHVSDLEVELTDAWDRALHTTQLDPDIVILDLERMGRAAELVDDDPDDLDGLNLLVNVNIARGAEARHPIGEVAFHTDDLQADITGEIVAVSGSVDVQRGEVEFLGREFEVRPGEVVFGGDIPPDPRLRLEAHFRLDRDITRALGPPATGEPRIEIHVGGTARDPTIQFSSDPAMTDTEILFVLMTERPPDRTEVGREEGVAQQALAAASGVFIGMLQDQLAGVVPFDVVRLEPAVAGARGGRLEVGTFLTNNLFFGYRREFGADEDVPGQIFRLEYHFLPRWMTEIVYTDHNEGELNLYWDVF